MTRKEQIEAERVLIDRYASALENLNSLYNEAMITLIEIETVEKEES